jgi:menaquinone-dependent protoporphyrinogen oxidase
MTNKILVTYATLSGTTVDVAQAIGKQIEQAGLQVDVLPIPQVRSLESYRGVVVGGPMIAGWHREALAFLRKHRSDWQRIPLAVFVTAMTLTQTPVISLEGVPLCIDDGLQKPPARPDHLTFRESYARVENYARPILRAAGGAKPVSLAFFGGRLEYGRLPWWAVLFAMLIIQAPAGNKQNMPFVQSWAAGITSSFLR